MAKIKQTELLAEPSSGTALHWIGGQWLDSGEHRKSVNPATGEVIGSYAMGGRKEAELAVNAALRAFRETDWKDNRSLRSRVLNAMAARFEAYAERLAQVLATENGKILPHARFETATVPFNVRFNAALALTDHGRAAEVDEDSLSLLIRQPVGVAGIFAPWNAPIALGIRSLAPALAAGCTVAMILPKETAQVNALISEVISDTDGLPPGVVNVLTSGREGIKYLVETPDVPVISFTGSTQIGRAISAAGAARLKRFGLELGGKTPMVIFDDADLNAAVAKVTAGLIVFAGQFCMTGSRAIVQRGIADRFRTELAERLKKLRVGPASDPRSEMGPLINKPNVERVNSMAEDAIAAGAKIIVRGGPVTEGPLARGAFYRPTLLEVTDSSLPIVQQEVFGPVLTMQVFDGEAEAVSLSNDTGWPPACGRVTWTGRCAWRAHYRPGRSGSTIGPTCTTSLKKAVSSRVAGGVCAGKQVWMTFLNANTSSSNRGRSSVEGAPGYAGSDPYRSRFNNRLRETNRVSKEDEAQGGRSRRNVYSGATAAGESHGGLGG